MKTRYACERKNDSDTFSLARIAQFAEPGSAAFRAGRITALLALKTLGCKRSEPPAPESHNRLMTGDLVKIYSGTVFVDDGIHGWNGTDTITIIGTDNLK